MQTPSWVPDRPVSKGASAYHDAVVNTSWHKDNIKHLITLFGDKIKSSKVLIDFGAGTGASSIFLLEQLPKTSKLLLVDNSPSWLGKAYDILHGNKQVAFHILKKKGNTYMTLDEILGKNAGDHIVSANTVHLIPNIKETFQGIYDALKNKGTFTFQSGNILKVDKEKGMLMIDDSIDKVHDLALEIIRSDKLFKTYKKDLTKRIEQEKGQRKFVFPTPRPLEFYLDTLREVGFKNEKVVHKRIKVKYKDWLHFLRVRRLQAGILPEVGGKDASPQEEIDRDAIITQAALQLFKQLKSQNELATLNSFTAEWIYVQAEK